MHGGMKVYRGAAAAARAYVEADHSRADDYYLTEGSGLATRYVASHDGVRQTGQLDGPAYERWVAGYDVETAVPKGRLRKDEQGVRFVEVVVNGPKTWSLAASLYPDVAAAYDAAQERAATQIIGWVAEHATTRVGPRGRQVQVPVEEIEAAVVRHYTSRAGDPHRHLHLQINARVFAHGSWRGLHTVGMRDSLAAINGIGHAAVATDPQFRAALAAEGLTLDPESAEVAELAPFAGAFSARAAQIGRNLDRYESEWRTANPGTEPGPALRRAWDRRAWSDARPDKPAPTGGADLVEHWNAELRRLGFTDREPQLALAPAVRPGGLDRDAVVAQVLARLGARRSGWNAADIRGEVEQLLACTGMVAEGAVRTELAEDLTARAVEACTPLLQHPGVPEHVRALTSRDVLAVEAELVTRMIDRAMTAGDRARVPDDTALDLAQRSAVALLAGTGRLIVIEGAAGAGKTTTLATTGTAIDRTGHRLVVVTPTLKAAQVARQEIGASANSAAWLIHQHGYRWDESGHWDRVASEPSSAATLHPGDLLLVDEAGMLDQDTARALLTIADETGARLALVGDRHQLPAVGRGGVLDLATRFATAEAQTTLEVLHRFSDPDYAAISLAMRTGTRIPVAGPTGGEANGEHQRDPGAHRYQVVTNSEPTGESSGERGGEVFSALWARDQIKLYTSDAERTHALAELAAARLLTGDHPVLVMADTRERVAALNGAIRDRLVASGYVHDEGAIVSANGERLGVGDRVSTRLNDRTLGVANRDTWTISAIGSDGALTLQGRHRTDIRAVPAGYAREQVELAYATTVYGAQGETTSSSHLVLGEHSSASSAYVGMTRGRDDNVAHLVANDIEDARAQWNEAFSRDRADLGPTNAAQCAAEDVERYGEQRPLSAALADLRAAWTEEQRYRGAVERALWWRNRVASYGVRAADRVAEIDRDLAEERALLEAASGKVRERLREPVIRAMGTAGIKHEHAAWNQAMTEASRAAHDDRRAQESARRRRLEQESYRRPPDTGRGIGW
ncbi:ATP-dependent exoDNAse (Exonuclease V) alpha subunit-helicase superfamily I member-like protein [metagenome]|uniref:ATP-dependent exoDNAse (Exonuclease V) alpha subunit-helicase superfamily I member-like protein n=1 Tax=metagenome TaxID=256318 RepID=A0A2P2BXZ8_9ZZZZ